LIAGFVVIFQKIKSEGRGMRYEGKGFTLAELLIVIVILGILGGIALPKFFPQAEKGRVAEAVGMLSAIRMGEEAYKLENGVYLAITNSAAGTEWNKIGMDSPNTSTADSRNFEYSVALVSSRSSTGLPGFDATATRCTAQSWCKNDSPSAEYGGKTIILNELGVWDSAATHPFKPS